MGIILWLAKPILYVGMFAIAAAVFRKRSPGAVTRLPAHAFGGGLSRLLLGALVAYLLLQLGSSMSPTVMKATFFVCGTISWVLVSPLTFRKVPLRDVLVFAAIGELIGGAIDLLAYSEAQNIRFC